MKNMLEKAEISKLEFHLPGLLKLLGESLYSDPRVAFRELVQNAHDSCVRHRVESDDSSYTPSIRIRTWVDQGRSYVTISDNGDGLDEAEIRNFLATVGRGRTAEVRSALEAAGDAGAYDLVCQFCVGLLAAFLVADRVEVVTRRRGASTGFRWVCEGQQTYRLEGADVRHSGTTVRLRIRTDRSEMGEPQIVRSTVHHYARYLDVPIFFEDESIALNARHLPWLKGGASDTRARLTPIEIATEWCGGRTPVALFELAPFTHPELGFIPLDGLLAIPGGSEVSVGEFGSIAVLIRRMLITTRERDLLPSWARFATGIVDCPLLQPTASREQVRQDRLFFAIRDEIGRQLLAELRRLQREQPIVWSQVADAHDALLKTWSARSPELFETVADHIPFSTTRGRMTLSEYLELSDGAIYYFSSEQEARAMSLLVESTARPVVDAQWFGDEPFLRLYAERAGVRLVRELIGGANGLLAAVETASEGMRNLALELSRPDLEVVLSSFEPASVPAIVLTPRRAEVQQRVLHSLEEDRPLRAFQELLARYARETLAPDERRVLHLNIRCPLVVALSAMPASGTTSRAAINLIGELARLLSGERLSPADLARCTRVCMEEIASLADVDVSRCLEPKEELP